MGFPQDYDALRKRLEHGPGLHDRDHLIIRGSLVDGVWTNGSASTIRRGEVNVENNVELDSDTEQSVFEIMQIMKTKHDTAKAMINNVR